MAVDPKYQGYSIGSKLLDAIKQNAFIHDRKTGKPNTLYLKPVQTELLLYRQ
ncbi:GNAT family N-acetyltransferase, partial [Oenococcus oeni]